MDPAVTLKQLVLDEAQTVTYLTLSLQAGIKASEAKNVMAKFVEAQGGEVSALYAVTGLVGATYQCRLVSASAVAATEKSFTTLHGSHVYSVAGTGTADPVTAVWNAVHTQARALATAQTPAGEAFRSNQASGVMHPGIEYHAVPKRVATVPSVPPSRKTPVSRMNNAGTPGRPDDAAPAASAGTPALARSASVPRPGKAKATVKKPSSGKGGMLRFMSAAAPAPAPAAPGASPPAPPPVLKKQPSRKRANPWGDASDLAAAAAQAEPADDPMGSSDDESDHDLLADVEEYDDDDVVGVVADFTAKAEPEPVPELSDEDDGEGVEEEDPAEEPPAAAKDLDMDGGAAAPAPRGRRKVLVTKTVEDEDGYLVEESRWESASEEDEPAPPPAAAAPAAQPAADSEPKKKPAAKPAAKGKGKAKGKQATSGRKQAGLMSFFGKK